MSILTPRRPSSLTTDPADGTSHDLVQDERRVFPGWRWMAVWAAFPVAGTTPRVKVTPAWQIRAVITDRPTAGIGSQGRS